MATYKIPMEWVMTTTVEVEAANETEAFQKVKEMPIPDTGDYVEGSWAPNFPAIEMMEENGESLKKVDV